MSGAQSSAPALIADDAAGVDGRIVLLTSCRIEGEPLTIGGEPGSPAMLQRYIGRKFSEPINVERSHPAKEVEEAIELARTTGDRQRVRAPGGAIAFADLAPPTFAHSTGGIAWGIISAEDGSNVWHGVSLPDGKDVLEEALSLDLAGLSCK